MNLCGRVGMPVAMEPQNDHRSTGECESYEPGNVFQQQRNAYQTFQHLACKGAALDIFLGEKQLFIVLQMPIIYTNMVYKLIYFSGFMQINPQRAKLLGLQTGLNSELQIEVQTDFAASTVLLLLIVCVFLTSNITYAAGFGGLFCRGVFCLVQLKLRLND